MKSDKVLIFSVYDCNLTDGGPSGFLAHNLIGERSSNYVISTDISKSLLASQTNTDRIISKAKKVFIDRKIHSNKTLILKSNYCQWYLSARQNFSHINAEKYKFIYFHDVWTLYFCLDLLNENQVVILQSHCPQLPSEEVASNPKSSLEDFDMTCKCEIKSFARANIIIFPNSKSASIYNSLIQKNSQIEYLLSGAKEKKDLRILPLKEDTINFLYIGRRNNIKGFDIILKGFKDAYKQRKDINLIVAGSGEYLHEDGVYDIGFTTSPHNWIFSCDYVLNCNRQSYFDLSVLETLSIGTPIILTTSFGHQQFLSDNSLGIISLPEASEKALEHALCSKEIRKRTFNQAAIKDNKRIYLEKYSDAIYRENLEKLLIRIMDNF
jgi:glycosyltransferase involved in cell wall biosynthesis